MHYTYRDRFRPWGDGLSKTLFSIRDRMGNRWTEKMQEYFIRKNILLGGYRWREKVPTGIPYVKMIFTEV